MTEKLANNYLETLEQVKKQYEQYVEVSKLYELPTEKKQEEPQQRLFTSSTFENVRGK